MKKKVVIFSSIMAGIEQKLQQQFDVVKVNPRLGDVDQQIRDAVSDAHGLIGAGRKLGAAQLEGARQLEIISSISVGYDNYDLAYLKQHGIKLAHTPHVLTETTADTAFTLLMSAARRVVELDKWTRAGQWTRTVSTPEFGIDVYGKTLGIIGLGHIGTAVARRGFYGFNMQVLYHGRAEKPEVANALNAEFVSLEQLLTRSDFVVVAVDLNAKTKHLLGTKEFSLLQKHAVLVNISRGDVLDEVALVSALQQKQFLAAGLDVYAQEPLSVSPLFELANVVLTPHIGSATHQTRLAMNQLAYDNLYRQLTGQGAKYLVAL